MADLVVAPLSIALVSGPTEDCVYGGTVAAGAPVYLDAADSNRAKAADANGSGTRTVRGISLDAGTTGTTGRIALNDAVVNLGVTLGVGTPYFLSSDPGGICPLADVGTGEDLVVLGAGATAANFKVHVWNSAIAHA